MVHFLAQWVAWTIHMMQQVRLCVLHIHLAPMTLFAILIMETRGFVKVAVPTEILIKRSLIWLVVQILYQTQASATVKTNVYHHQQVS
jgi:hypothetical protein|tara:strand:- start:156 stop:419 length:264 start_codon:yes stop_codon:yes gene_type:complete